MNIIITQPIFKNISFIYASVYNFIHTHKYVYTHAQNEANLKDFKTFFMLQIVHWTKVKALKNGSLCKLI